MNNPQLTLRSLKGAPLSVLMTLHLAARPLQQKALITWTGYSGKTVAAALDLLAGMEAVQSHGRQAGWSLTPAGAALWQLLAGDAAQADEAGEAETAVVDEEPDAPAADDATPAPPPTPPRRKFSGSNGARRKISVLPPSSSLEIYTREIYTSPGKKKRAGPGTSTEKTAVFHLLRRAGIGISMSQHLSRLEWVTVPYARAHLEKIRRDGDPLRYAIQRMREGDALPVCDCGRCDACRERYLERTGLLDVVMW